MSDITWLSYVVQMGPKWTYLHHNESHEVVLQLSSVRDGLVRLQRHQHGQLKQVGQRHQGQVQTIVNHAGQRMFQHCARIQGNS